MLRLNVLAQNEVARSLYVGCGFDELSDAAEEAVTVSTRDAHIAVQHRPSIVAVRFGAAVVVLLQLPFTGD